MSRARKRLADNWLAFHQDLPGFGDLPHVHLALYCSPDELMLQVTSLAPHVSISTEVLIQPRGTLTDRQAADTFFALLRALLALPEVSEFSGMQGVTAPARAIIDRWHRILKQAKRRARS